MNETIVEYRNLLNRVDEFIKLSGYRIDYLQEKLGISRVSFWRKRKNGEFTIKEMEILSEFIFTDEIEDRLLLKIMNETTDPEFMSSEDSEAYVRSL
jgi:hypothetical protein